MGKRRVKTINKTLKFTGIVCGIFTTIQAVIWLILTITGILYFFSDSGEGETAAAFHDVYMSSSEESPSVCVKPTGFILFNSLYFLLSALWLYASINLITVYNSWNNVSAIKKASRLWMAITFVICILDVLIFILFLVDFILIGKEEETKTRSSDVSSMIARLFTSSYADIMTREFYNETKAKIDEFYKKKYNIDPGAGGPAGDSGGGKAPDPADKGKGGADPTVKPDEAKKEETPAAGGDPPKPEPEGGGGGAERRSRFAVQNREKRSIGSMIKEGLQTVWDTSAYAYSFVPDLPVPNFIQNLIGNPFNYFLDSIEYGLFGLNRTPQATTPAPEIPEVKLYNPKTPPAICMAVALRGVIIWLVNCFLLAFMYKLLTQLRVEMHGIFGCFFDLCKSDKPSRKKRKRPMY